MINLKKAGWRKVVIALLVIALFGDVFLAVKQSLDVTDSKITYTAENDIAQVNFLPKKEVFVGKIHEEVAEEIAYLNESEKKEKITVLLQITNEDDTEKIANSVNKAGGEVKGKYEIGDVIAANIPADKIGDVADDSSVDTVWPNRKYSALLEESIPQINAPFLWAEGFNGSGIKIAILDTGIYSAHPMLQGKVILEEVFTGETNVQDVNGHGTHAAGIAAGKKAAEEGYIGVAPEAYLINAKVLNDSGDGTELAIISGMNWAIDPDGNSSTDDGADIISMSLGGPYVSDGPLNSAVRDAVAKGIIVVISSGNCGSPEYCGGYIGVTSPGNTEEAITVGAVDDLNNWAPFSSGQDFGSYIKPDVVAPGVNIISSVPGGYAAFSGTSMAAPHVAGAIALLLQSNPELESEQVKYIIEATAKPLGKPGKDTMYGSGLIDLSKFIPPNVNKLLKFRISVPEMVYEGEPVEILINDTFGQIQEINATATTPTTTFLLNFTNITLQEWKALLTNTSEVGRYHINISILDFEGNVTDFYESIDVIKYNLTKGRIKELIVPEEIAFNDPLNITVVFENLANESLETIFEAQIVEGDVLLESIETKTKIIPPETTTTFLINWVAHTGIGEKILKVIAAFEGESYVKEKTFRIIDNATPVISEVIFDSELFSNSPATITLLVDDLSDVVGAITFVNPSGLAHSFELQTDSRINGKTELAFTYLETTEIGNYTFNLTVCDVGGICTSSEEYNFSVKECSGPRLLIVSEYNNNFKNLIGDCVSELKPITAPPISYLRRFDGVIWRAGTPGILQENSKVLTEYAAADSKLVIEGEDIAFKHKTDDFMKNVTHGALDKDLFIADKNVSITTSLNHPIFKNLPGNLPVNSSLSPYPDSIIPLESVELAKWSEAGSAITVYNSGNKKVLFIAFKVEALNELSDTFINNVVEWLVEESELDFRIDSLNHNYLVEGENIFELAVENTGTIERDAHVTVYIDKEPATNFTINVSAESISNKQFVLILTAGKHSIGLELNSDFKIRESNYLNNFYTEEVLVAKTEPDLVINELSYNYSNSSIDTMLRITNLGGTIAENIKLSYYLDGENVENKTVSLGRGETDTIYSDWDKEERRIYNLEVVLDPDNKIIESDETNNNYYATLYICNVTKILIVDDDDSGVYSTPEPSSAAELEQILREGLYCVNVWSEKDKGVPSSDYINNFDLVVWSTGTYWNGVLDEEDAALISQHDKVLFEGEDIAFDRNNDSFMQHQLHSIFYQDILLENDSELVLSSHPILHDVSVILINASLAPYPDSVEAVGAVVVAGWPMGGAAITAYNDSNRSRAYFAFPITAVMPQENKERLVLNAVDWLLKNPNVPPELKEIANIVVNESEMVVIVVNASDRNKDLLTYSINDSRFNQSGNVFSWQTGYDDAGTYSVNITVSDGKMSASTSFLVIINNVNRAPVIQSFTPNRGAVVYLDENASLLLTAEATDPDNDLFSYQWTVNETNTSSNNSFSFVPDFESSGAYNITLTVSDYSLSTSHSILVIVSNVNRPPLLAVSDVTVNENESAIITAKAFDPDNDTVYYYINDSRFSQAENVFTWKTGFHDAGVHHVAVTVSDGAVNVPQLVLISVLDVNVPPNIAYSTPDATTVVMDEGEATTFVAEVSNPDEDLLSYAWLLNEVLVSETDRYTFSPAYDDSGTYNLTFIVSDGVFEDSKQFTILVNDTLECGDGQTELCGLQEGACVGSYQVCTDGLWPGCSAEDYGENYESEEVSCDGLDNNCDGEVDEGDACIPIDLAITKFTTTKNTVLEMQRVWLSITIKNVGAEPVYDFDVLLDYGDGRTEPATINFLGVGEQFVTQREFLYKKEGNYTITIQLFAPNGTKDVNSDNDFAAITVEVLSPRCGCPDVNDDGVVNVLDSVKIGLNYGRAAESCAVCDLNSDGLINKLDLGCISLYFNTKASEIEGCS
jgi:subtilisin family serine protease/PKD repeat protein